MTRRYLPTAGVLLLLALTVSGAVALSVRTGERLTLTGSLSSGQMLFALVGAWILFARPNNRVGWLFAAVGLLATTGQLAESYVAHVLMSESHKPSLAVAAAWYSEWYWMPWLFLFLSGTSLLFPTGRPLSGRWTFVAWVIAIAAAALTVSAALDPVLDVVVARRDAVVGPSGGPEVIEIANPVGVSPFGDPDEAPLIFAFLPLLFASAVAAVISLVLRFRRSKGDERQQMKWFVYAAVLMVGGFVVFGALDGFGYRIPEVLEGILQAVLPTAAAIAIFRYRLYDIDVVINRTLVYGALTAMLAGAYLSIVVLLQAVLTPVAADSDVVIAASTLSVAALFRPLRSRVQTFIDHRFYRRKYDAVETLRAFSNRLRDQVDLDSVNAQVIAVVTDTIQPVHASLWLRPRSGS